MIDSIASIPLFEGLSKEQQKDLADIALKKNFKRGKDVFFEGDEGDGFYVVISGQVKIFKVSIEGKEQILHIFGPGEPFGEVPVFAGERFPANAKTIEDSRLLFFPRDAFVKLVKRNPSLALNMLAVLSCRLRRFTGLIENLSLKEVPGRLAAYLLYLYSNEDKKDTLVLKISKGQLASILGTIPETLSRILSKMSKEKLIRSDGSRSLQILDIEGLEELASGQRRLS
ncbi:MAG: Crp/Fnr family transcriptional regulator [Thermodesulfobacteriota bacterium]|nr:Crp/Fnr family transcriptional regulator [Thermodesulfobacteriota bacterium]